MSQERYFVCSEGELKRLRDAAWDATDPYYGSEPLVEAEAACRVRPVKPLYNFHGEITQWVDEED